MEKAVITHTVIGAFIILIGTSLKFTDAHALADPVMTLGIVYVSATLGIVVARLFGRKLKPHIEAASRDKCKTRAYEDLGRLKGLLDRGIISQAEFDSKARELKSQIL